MTPTAKCRSLIIFVLCLLKVVNINAQCETPSLGGDRILASDSSQPPYQDGSTATFKCAVGYQPSDPRASKVITCNGNTWTELQLQCKKKDCRPLADIQNGKFSYSPEGDEGTLFGATATAKCYPGYKVAGQATRRCRDTGWDGRNPICEVVKCSRPPMIQNGETEDITEDEYQYQQAVSYICNDGYTLFGSSMISCSEDGTFQPPPPRCTKVSCQSLSIQNGQRIEGIPPYGYKSIIKFACDRGYKMEGQERLLCEENGWNSDPPQCIVEAPPTRPTSRPTKPAIEGGVREKSELRIKFFSSS